MIKSINFLSVIFLSLFISSCSTSAEAQNINPKYSIASVEYEQLAEKALRHVEKFQFSELYDMVSDDIEYYLPDGGEESRTRFIGKQAFIGFWNSYQEKSGNDQMTATNLVHIPVAVKDKLAYTKVSGVMVLSYFSLNMKFGAEEADVRANWGFHFNADKKIDRIYSYYDRTPIIAAAKRNILSKK